MRKLKQAFGYYEHNEALYKTMLSIEDNRVQADYLSLINSRLSGLGYDTYEDKEYIEDITAIAYLINDNIPFTFRGELYVNKLTKPDDKVVKRALLRLKQKSLESSQKTLAAMPFSEYAQANYDEYVELFDRLIKEYSN